MLDAAKLEEDVSIQGLVLLMVYGFETLGFLAVLACRIWHPVRDGRRADAV